MTDAVHQAGSKIFAQLWHVGRVSHTILQPGHAAPDLLLRHPGRRVKVFVDVEGRGRNMAWVKWCSTPHRAP